MKLEKLLEVLEIKEKINEKDDIEIKGIAYHSARVKEGFIYVAIKGYITDGHKYIKEAEKKWCSGSNCRRLLR